MSEEKETEVKVQYKEEASPSPNFPDTKQGDQDPKTPTEEVAHATGDNNDSGKTTPPGPDSQIASASTLDTPKQLRVQDLINTTASNAMADGSK